MIFEEYDDERHDKIDGWTVVVVKSPFDAKLLSEHVEWLTERPSQGRFFLQPFAAAFWFERQDDAFLYHLHFGGHAPHVHREGQYMKQRKWHRLEKN